MDGILENTSMKLKQNIYNHLKVQEFTIITTLMFLIYWILFLNYDYDFILVVGLFHLTFTILSIYLHIEYIIENYKLEIEITENQFIVTKDNQRHFYSKSKVSKIILYKSASIEKGGIPFSAMEYYFYLKVVLDSNEEILITCLLINDLDMLLSKFQGINFERKNRFFCSKFWR